MRSKYWYWVRESTVRKVVLFSTTLVLGLTLLWVSFFWPQLRTQTKYVPGPTVTKTITIPSTPVTNAPVVAKPTTTTSISKKAPAKTTTTKPAATSATTSVKPEPTTTPTTIPPENCQVTLQTTCVTIPIPQLPQIKIP